MDQIHAAEFAVHMGLHASQPVWQFLFGARLDSVLVERLASHFMTSQETFQVSQVEKMVHTAFGANGQAWMRDTFISTAVPRFERQRRVMLRAVGPSVLSAQAAPARQALLPAIDRDTLARLEALEGLMDTLEQMPDDPRETELVAAASSLIDAHHPARRLVESLYMKILDGALIRHGGLQ